MVWLVQNIFCLLLGCLDIGRLTVETILSMDSRCDLGFASKMVICTCDSKLKLCGARQGAWGTHLVSNNQERNGIVLEQGLWWLFLFWNFLIKAEAAALFAPSSALCFRTHSWKPSLGCPLYLPMVLWVFSSPQRIAFCLN